LPAGVTLAVGAAFGDVLTGGPDGVGLVVLLVVFLVLKLEKFAKPAF